MASRPIPLANYLYLRKASAGYSPDQAIPSIEGDSNGSVEDGYTLTAPSLSLSLLSGTNSHATNAKGKSATGPGRGADRIDAQLGNMRISDSTPSSRGRSPPHELVDEEPSVDIFNEPRFQQASKDAKSQISELRNVLGSRSLHTPPDSTVKRLHSEAEDLANFQCP